MSHNSQPVEIVFGQTDLNPTVVPRQLPGQRSTPAVVSPRSDPLPGSALPTLDPRSEVKSSKHSKPPPSLQIPLSTRRSIPQPNNHSNRIRSQPAQTKMSTRGYLEGTASSDLKSKIPRKAISGGRSSPHIKPVNQTATKSHSTKPGQQPQLHKDEGNADTLLTASRESSTEISATTLPASLPALNEHQTVLIDVEQRPDPEFDLSSIPAESKNDHEPAEDGSWVASHEEGLSDQGEWVDDEVTLVNHSLHASIAKIVDLDFTQSTRTLVDEGDYVSNVGKAGTSQDDAQDSKSLDLSLDAIHPVEQAEEALVALNEVETQDLLDKLKAAEKQIVTLTTENEQRRRQVNETENRLCSLQENVNEIFATRKVEEQDLTDLLDQKDAENRDLVTQVCEMTLTAQALKNEFKSKCDECDELIAGAHAEHPSELQLQFAVEELGRVQKQHEKALEEAEARFQVERNRHEESVKEQDEEVQLQELIIAELEKDGEETRKALHDAEGRVELREDSLRQMTDLRRREHGVGKSAERQIARLEFNLRRIREEGDIIKAEAEQTRKNLEVNIKQLEASDDALREELGKLQYLNEHLTSDAAQKAEETEKLRTRLSKAEEKVAMYLRLGPVRTDIKLEDYRPPKRLSHQEILASSDPTILRSALGQAWEKIRRYEVLGISKTRTPIEVRELDVIQREDEAIYREKAIARREEAVDRAAGAAGVEVILLKESLGEREKEVVHLKRIVRGLEDDLVNRDAFQISGPGVGGVNGDVEESAQKVGEVGKAVDADEEDIGVLQLGAKPLFMDDGTYIGLDIRGLGIDHLFSTFKVVDGIVGDHKDEFKDKCKNKDVVDEEDDDDEEEESEDEGDFHDAIEASVCDGEE